MRWLRARLPVVGCAVVVPLAALLAHCGGDDASSGGHDAGREGGSVSDGTIADSFVADSGANADSSGDDGTVSDASDGGAEPETGPPRIPCVPTPTVDAGDGGDDGGTGADAADGGDAGQIADAAEAGDAGATDGASADAADANPPAPCPGTMSCCGGWCTDISKDPQNCGACGNACSKAQFCTGVACDDAVLKNVCGNPKSTVVLDPYAPDDMASSAFGSALANGCMPAVLVSTVGQDAGGVEDPATGRPLTGPGDTLVAGGGYFGQAGVAYMESNKIAPLSLGTDGTNAWMRNTRTGMNVVMTLNSNLTAHHDFFALYVSVEPVSGTLCFFGYGMYAPGTTAAAYFFQNDVIGNRAMFPDAWYVYEWTDTDNDGIPNAADMFKQVASGM